LGRWAPNRAVIEKIEIIGRTQSFVSKTENKYRGGPPAPGLN
jgi:hypothetical protein